MNRSSLLAAGITVALLIPVAGIGASMNQEPQNGFVRGLRPSWTERHARTGTAEHQAFHTDAAAKIAAIRSASTSMEEKRAALQAIEKAHRVFHGWGTMPAHKSTVVPSKDTTTASPVSSLSPIGDSPLWSDGYRPIYKELRYEGSRPSARLLEEYARLRRLR